MIIRLTIEQGLTIAAIVLTMVNTLLIYFNLNLNRKKEFQDKLYQLKLDAYKELNDASYSATQRLDINSTPFVQIYNYKEESEWVKYCEKNMGEQLHQSFDLQKLTYKYTYLLPSSVIDKYHDFTRNCISFITMTYHFDTGLIIENQDKLWDSYIDLTNDFRSDLKIEVIDNNLRQRISSKI